MKSFFRFLYRNKLYTVIEVAGMAVAIAFVLFIGTFLIGEYTADSEIKKQGDIYVGDCDGIYMGSATIKDQVEGNFPEIENVSCVLWTNCLGGFTMDMTAGEKDEPFRQDAMIVDREFMDMMPIALLEGEKDHALEQRNAVLLSESFAAEAFPGRSPLGETVTITVNGTAELLSVTGVFRDFSNSILHSPQIMYRTDVMKDLYPNLFRNGNGTATVFYRIAEGTDIAALSDKVADVVRSNDQLYRMGLMEDYSLVPFGEIGSHDNEYTFPFEGVIPVGFIRLFLAAGLLLLVFAVLNYVSLTVAQTGFRAREMASRRLVGAQRSSIIARYVSESFILTGISFVLALVLTGLVSEPFSVLIGKDVDPLSHIGAVETVFMVGLVVLLSLCSGTVPALLVSKYRPIDIVKGNFSGKTKMTLGKVLITCQSIIAIATLSVAGVMFLQIRHMVSRPMGYETDGRIMVSGAGSADDYRVDELASVPGVEKIGWLQSAPMDGTRTVASMKKDGQEFMLNMFYCDRNAFEILGFEKVKVCMDHYHGGLWLPEYALAGLGLDYESMEIPFDDGVMALCGIIRNFIPGNADSSSAGSSIAVPVIIDSDSESSFAWLRQLVVKVSSDENEAAKRISALYEKDAPGILVETYNVRNRNLYNAEDRNLKLIGTFTLLTILLTSLAMLAMSTYFAKQHSKATALKKVMGCGSGRVFMDTASGFLKSVGIAAAVSVPVAWMIAGRWLEGYSYRIGNDIWIYVASAVGMAIVAVLSISWQTVRLMDTDPVEALKNE